MIVHILHMYNSKNLHTWDESLPYVQHSYNRALHSSTTIAHFRWGWDSNPWVPLMLHYLLQPHRKNLPMFSLRPTKPPDSLSGFNTSTNRSMRFCRNPMLSTSNAMINTGYHTSFRWETRSGYICRKSPYRAPSKAPSHFSMGLTLSPRLWVTMIFELNTPPFLGLHPVFNVDLLRPYFPPLLDTSEIVEQLTPTELNPDCMEHASTDQIVDTQVKGTRQQRIQLYQVVKAGQLLAPRQVAHPRPNSVEISSPDGGTQCNGDHFFLRGED
jgi:hypothetical protein